MPAETQGLKITLKWVLASSKVNKIYILFTLACHLFRLPPFWWNREIYFFLFLRKRSNTAQMAMIAKKMRTYVIISIMSASCIVFPPSFTNWHRQNKNSGFGQTTNNTKWWDDICESHCLYQQMSVPGRRLLFAGACRFRRRAQYGESLCQFYSKARQFTRLRPKLPWCFWRGSAVILPAHWV